MDKDASLLALLLQNVSLLLWYYKEAFSVHSQNQGPILLNTKCL